GSGKKYKNCCLKSENKKQVILQQRERFYESKQDLVEKVGDYLVQQVPIKQYNALKNTFHERTEKRIDKDIEESYFSFWLYFFLLFYCMLCIVLTSVCVELNGYTKITKENLHLKNCQ